ncbi:protein with SnoaL 3 domain, NTF 2 superfamily [Alteromonas aestuariivivens]|uniref:Protein with SnoaL 3 domain, NTF 2 superfamily n=1 Tax=Alteromonas aestuariivivens TaxID=1938339 RepID=A0A3D8M5E7_9ALTE|nr:nuclear transport factor 2 family protein [Alteromonas aestuariivivens]RDV24810.1 protein with SnoaL 3 domain, NTF 2 superfamily [Alteromonas aestuariivivens]
MRIITILLLILGGFAHASERERVGETLDKLHQYAAQADWHRYFDLYHPDATFIGTDASETWTIGEFKSYAKPVFNNGKGWTYEPQNRHIYFSPDGKVAWFDEMLSNASYGVTRGTGVLTLEEGAWKIRQYHLTIPIPNTLATDIAADIKAFSASKP